MIGKIEVDIFACTNVNLRQSLSPFCGQAAQKLLTIGHHGMQVLVDCDLSRMFLQ